MDDEDTRTKEDAEVLDLPNPETTEPENSQTNDQTTTIPDSEASIEEVSTTPITTETETINPDGREDLEGIARKAASQVIVTPAPEDQKVYEIDTEKKTNGIEAYIKRFTRRYEKESVFQEIVHKYMKLTGFGKFKLKVGRVFSESWYQKKRNALIGKYAEKVKHDVEIADEIKRDMQALKEGATQLTGRARDVKSADNKKETAQTEYQLTLEEEKAKVIETNRLAEEKRRKELLKKQAALEEIRIRTDAEAIVQEKLVAHVRTSGLIQEDPMGRLSFDEEKLVTHLEEMFLNEIVTGIEKEDGKTGFVARIKEEWSDAISHWAEIESLGELADIDWHQSIIYSRMHGYKKPVFPFLITAKYEPVSTSVAGRVSIPTAISIDTSGSMDQNNRFAVAKKAAMATKALMRRMNPENNTFLSRYCDNVFELTSKELYNYNHIYNGTNTHLALDWMLEKLAPEGVGFAYLITDGYPNYQQAAIESASRFRDHPLIQLRIFLIDPDRESKGLVKRIGEAAGPNTKFIPIDNYNLGGGMIRDVSECINGMYDMASFG
ncbi:hypothetical protein HN695_06650 [Candidatus Woesearchaeota archaeon]|jgi:hypothetical protein|nr:hypothetical protein [Candidatus Woesearchaeota archaeon]MBT6040738.1 hypothetical protein [Candidatus Woesearchaeota archaeon]MBT6337459.1 hypothetical protein [Candidatus Woesearchaeota archaeon]MBT7927985.1 hypothetical protein [Candidatus Woesearchaeota archaeon]